MLDLVLVCAAAALAGCVDAIVGGGGLIQLPAMLAVYPREAPATLLGTNKCASIFGTTSAVARYASVVRIPWRPLAPAVALALLASFGGAVAATHVPAGVFRPLVPVLLVSVLVYTLARQDLGLVHAPRLMEGPRQVMAAVLVSVIAFYDGFFGPGTGSFFMVLLIRLAGFDFVNAAASARVLNAATNLAAVVWFGHAGHIAWPLGLTMAAFNVAGAQVGSRLALTAGSATVRRIFIGVVVVLIVKTAWDAATR